jgi:2-methylcitrate dehydratase PrpD
MITQELAHFIVSLKYDDLPYSTIEKAKICFLDFLGVSLRGSKEKSSLIAFDVFNSSIFDSTLSKTFPDSESGHGLSTIIGHGGGEVINAGFLNGISAHCLDLDDGHRIAQLHPGCVVIPAALALAEKHDKTGKEFFEAIIAGYEVAIVLGKLINPLHRNHGFHSTGTIGTFAATAAACKIINLNEEEIINAIGLAGTQAAGLLESDHAGTMGKHLHAGKAVQSGIISTLLAQKGFTGASSILEGKEGFFKAMCGDNIENSTKMTSELALKQIKSDLGKFHIRDVYVKKYPVCRHLHSTIDSVMDILNEINVESIKDNEIKKITVKTYQTAAEHNNYCPSTMESVRQSLPISLAIALNQGDLTLENIQEFENNSQFKKEIMKTAKKVSIQIDKDLDNLQPQKRPSRVLIELKNSNMHKTYEKITFLPKGEPENPFTKKEIFNKFYSLNKDLYSSHLDLIDVMETEKLNSLMKVLMNPSIN